MARVLVSYDDGFTWASKLDLTNEIVFVCLLHTFSGKFFVFYVKKIGQIILPDDRILSKNRIFFRKSYNLGEGFSNEARLNDDFDIFPTNIACTQSFTGKIFLRAYRYSEDFENILEVIFLSKDDGETWQEI